MNAFSKIKNANNAASLLIRFCCLATDYKKLRTLCSTLPISWQLRSYATSVSCHCIVLIC